MKKIFIITLVILGLTLFINPKAKTEALDSYIEENKIGIDIKGAVKSPGYYELDLDSTVYDAIKVSGGLANYADTSIINLSKKLKDEDVIIIYTIDEVNEMKSGSTSIKIIEKTCMCPKIDNVACIDDVITNVEGNNKKVNINKASKEELMTLSGIGESKANSIIEYRNNKPFEKIEDIMNVKGIGNSVYNKIKDLISV